MKVYVVMYNDWEDGRIVSMWSTFEAAERERARLHRLWEENLPAWKSRGERSHYDVEEHEVKT